jgi:hypothetical protein
MRRLPLTNAIVYLAIGIILGPSILIELGLPTDLALELLHITLVVVTLSIFLHGISTKPALAHYPRPAWQSRTS